MIETERLLLREYTMDDFEALYEIVSDEETMQHYPAPFDEAKTRHWIEWNLENYSQYGFGLWAVVLKETGEFIGDCGITMQNIDGEMLPEIGYHIQKKHWRHGFAKEAACAVRDWVFQNTDYDTIYSYMKNTNVGSYSTAISNGMKKVKEYPDPKNTISYAFAITREEWEKLIIIGEERITAEEYIDFLKRTDLGSQYPKERFEERIAKLVKNVSISLVARNEDGLAVGVLFGLTDFCYWLYITDLGVDRNYERRGIATRLMKKAHELAGGEKDIAVYLVANENAVPFYQKLGMKYADDVMQYNHIDWTEWTVE